MPRRLAVAALAFWALLAVLFVQRLAGRSLDDFFITYRYAWNLAHGNGFVFNPGERVYGVTEPGMVLWLAFWTRLTRVPVHWLGTVTTAVGMLATATLMLWEGVRSGRGLACFLGGTLFMGSAFLWSVHGAGVPMVLALLTAAAVWGERRPGLAGGLAGAAVWFRPDAGVGLAALGLLLWRERRRFPLRFALVAALVLAAGLLASGLYFGAVIPNTLAAKRSFAIWDPAARASGAAFWAGATPLLRRHFGGLWPTMAVLGVAGQWPLWKRGGRPGRLLALFGGSLALLYPLLRVPFFAWYVVPTVTALLYGLGFAVAGVAGKILSFLVSPLPAGGGREMGEGPGVRGHRAATPARVCLGILLFLLAAVPEALRGWRWAAAAADEPHHQAYRAAGLWIHDHSSPAATVSALEVGTLAYFSERRFRDLLGLVTPEAIGYVERRNVAQAFYDDPTELLVLKPSLEGLLGPLSRTPWFRRRYEEAVRFPAGGSDEVVIFRHRVGPHVPPLE